MNGVHDMGGMDGFGLIPREANEPVFHADWERRVFALALATIGARHYNVDEFRRTIERMPPASYLTASYYERWLHAIESLLVEKGVVGREELDAAAPGALPAYVARGTAAEDDDPAARRLASGAAALRRDRSFKARFKPGDRVIAKNINPDGHTRIPRYARGHRGVIKHDWGVFVFPDTHAHGRGVKPQHCYSVEFSARELWGDEYEGRERVLLDLWEDYLERGRRPNGRSNYGAPPIRARARTAPPARKSKAASKTRRPR